MFAHTMELKWLPVELKFIFSVTKCHIKQYETFT